MSVSNADVPDPSAAETPIEPSQQPSDSNSCVTGSVAAAAAEKTLYKRTGIFPPEVEQLIFDHLLATEKRKTCGVFTRLSKDRNAKYARQFWHTIVISKTTAKALGRVLVAARGEGSFSKRIRLIKRVVFATPPEGTDLEWYTRLFKDDSLGELLSLSINEIVICRSFMIQFTFDIHAAGYVQEQTPPEAVALPRYAKLVRELIFDTHQTAVFIDLDFPITFDIFETYRKKFYSSPPSRSSLLQAYRLLGNSGVNGGILEMLLGERDDEEFRDYCFLSRLTLWNFQLPAAHPEQYYDKYIISHRRGPNEMFQLEHGLELILEIDAHRILIQGYKYLDDEELQQAADELVISGGRGGRGLVKRMVKKVKFGPRRHAETISDTLRAWTKAFPINRAAYEYDRFYAAPEVETHDPAPKNEQKKHYKENELDQWANSFDDAEDDVFFGAPFWQPRKGDNDGLDESDAATIDIRRMMVGWRRGGGPFGSLGGEA